MSSPPILEARSRNELRRLPLLLTEDSPEALALGAVLLLAIEAACEAAALVVMCSGSVGCSLCRGLACRPEGMLKVN